MSRIRESWSLISKVGIIEGMDSRLQRKVKLTNQIAFVGIAMTALQLLAFSSIFGYAILCLGAIGLYGITFFLNKQHLWTLSRIYFCTISCLVIVVSGSLITENTNFSFRLMIIQAFVIPLVVFEIHEKREMLLGFGVFALSYIFFDPINEMIPIIKGLDSSLFDSPQNILVNGILCMITLYLGYHYMLKLNYAAEIKLARSLATTKRQKELIEKKSKDVQDGINYAQRIQQAILPDTDDIGINLPDNFVFYKPKEKIGGDFFWYGEMGNHIIYAAVDCTGHGTPGALISIIGSKLLDKIVKEHGVTDPAEILELMNLEILSTLHSEWSVVRDGMDMTIVSIDVWQRKVTFAGAKNSILISRGGEIERIRGDRASIGDTHILEDGFTNHTFRIDDRDCIYLTTDGIIDQFGGPNDKKLMNRRLYEILSKNSDYSMELQQKGLQQELSKWQGTHDQVDDILMLGFRIDFEHINIVKRFRNNNGFNPEDVYQQAS